MSKILTRRELYDLVWSTPITTLASEFGISDVGLQKLCNRHRVPTPGRGYWAKCQAGQDPKKTIFAEVKDIHLNRIEIRPGLVELPEPVRQVIESHKVERRALAVSAPPKPQLTRIYEPVADVHPTVRRTVTALRRCKSGDSSVSAVGDGLCGVEVSPGSVERAAYVLDALARALEVKSMPMIATGQAMRVAVGVDAAVFKLIERTRTVPHEPTEAELALEARREEQRERYWRNPTRSCPLAWCSSTEPPRSPTGPVV